MFKGCTALTTAPELPATTLTNFCYESMFENCTSLTTAPELPATELWRGEYIKMFRGCTSLNCVKAAFTNVGSAEVVDYSGGNYPTTYYYYSIEGWLGGISTKGTIYLKNNISIDCRTTYGTLDYKHTIKDDIPYGWTVETYNQ
jgi:hypothetical protein